MPDKDLVSESEKNQETKAAALFSKQNMVFTCLDVPQQTNSYDCGVFILQYAESFMKVTLCYASRC